ncbi:MAG: glycerol kinase GlpK [Chthonomonadales bacterium]
MASYLLALDQGTTSSRAILFDLEGRVVCQFQIELPQVYPQPGWVEQDPEAIFQTQLLAARQALAQAHASARDVVAIGIACQRETTILWERATGRPISNAIVWQDRRTAPLCKKLVAEGAEPFIRRRTGLLLDPYFSATKIAWLLDHVPGARLRAERGELAFGTVDTFLLWRLTGGHVHATDVTNASRTLLLNIRTLKWDEELASLFGIPMALLPQVCPSSFAYASTAADMLGAPIPVCGLAGDQQAAAFGQACFRSGMLKNTYGTGSFLLLNTGHRPVSSRHRLIATPACGLPDRLSGSPDTRPSYALEGSVFVSGAAVQWLRDELGVINRASEIEALAASVSDTAGVVMVPAFSGLGAPYWDADARGALLGLTRGTSRAHIARAALEAACFQTRDVVEAMKASVSVPMTQMRVDGGMAANNLLMQMQADLLGLPVLRPRVTETTALGAAFLAGLAAGVYHSTAELASFWRADRTFEPAISQDCRDAHYERWRMAVAAARRYKPSQA